MVLYSYLLLLSVFILWFAYYVSDIVKFRYESFITRCVGGGAVIFRGVGFFLVMYWGG